MGQGCGEVEELDYTVDVPKLSLLLQFRTKIQLTLAISNSLISNNRLFQSENLVPA